MRVSALVLFVLSFAAVTQTIAVIDSERIFESLGEVSDASELLEAEIEEWEAHADSLQDEIDAIQVDLDYTMVMSPERRHEREQLLDSKTEELQIFLEGTFGPGGLVETRNNELVSPIIASINEAVQEISLEEDYDMVLDTSAGVVVFVSNSMDITDAVLDRLATGGDN